MTDKFATTLDQLSINPGLFVITGAALALLITAGRQMAAQGSPIVTVTTAATISIAASTTFAVLTSLQSIVTAPIA